MKSSGKTPVAILPPIGVRRRMLILTEVIDTTTPAGRMMMQMVGGFR